MKKMCAELGIKVPPPSVDARSRLVYRIVVGSDEMMFVARHLVDHGCKPTVGVCYYAPSSVELKENRRDEAWFFKYFARSEDHAETIVGDVLTILEPHREWQMELGI